jgi:hypothetical protein
VRQWSAAACQLSEEKQEVRDVRFQLQDGTIFKIRMILRELEAMRGVAVRLGIY